MQVNIRPEIPADYPQIARVVQQAFEHDPHGEQDEHLLVARLRESDSFIPELSMVAEVGGQVVGHILLTRINIKAKHEDFESLALAPVSVLPEFQNQGMGGKLISAAHDKARALGFKSVILIGHAQYYPRFGYRTIDQYGITLPFEAPGENCMALELVEDGLNGIQGLVEYPREFFE